MNDLEKALYLAKIIHMPRDSASCRKHLRKTSGISTMERSPDIWRGGCIIRSVFLDKMTRKPRPDPKLPNLLLAPYFQKTVVATQQCLRNTLAAAIRHGIPVPCHSSALNYYDGYRSARLPANLLQAQRDYFGAHTYERLDKDRGEFFHTNWTGEGGDTTSSAYTR